MKMPIIFRSANHSPDLDATWCIRAKKPTTSVLCGARGTRNHTYTIFHWIKQYKIFRIENRENEGDLFYNRNDNKDHACEGEGA
jgi:hypothetical protein